MPDHTNGPLFRWRFGTVEYDEARRELRVAGLPVEMENRPLEVLSLLLRHVGEVVTKQALFAQVWGGRPTVDHVLSTAVGKLRKVLEVAGERRIATVPRVGYRFDGTLEKIAVGQQAANALQLDAGMPVPGRASLVLERRLARTQGHEVWLARQPRSRQSRVFKFAREGGSLASLKREATLSRVLQESLGERADLVRVLDWNFEQAPFFLECEDGGPSLPDWVAQGHLAALEQPARIVLFLQLVDVVAAAHEVGVLHKDLKPANVLVAAREPGWQLQLGDFGNSRLLQPERLVELGITGLGLTLEDGDLSGTPLYLAPELLAGQPPSVRSDVHALGVMLYQWLAGDLRRPLAPGWERDIDDALLREDIAAATDVDPARRIGSAAELAERLRNLPERNSARERRIADAGAAEALGRALERARARRPWRIAAMVLLALGAACSSLLWWRAEQQRQIAQRQAARAEASLQFFNRALATLSTGNSGYDHDPTIRDMLEYVSASGASGAAGDPDVQGDLHALLGRSWRLLGDPVRAAAEYRAAIRAYTQALGEDDAQTLMTRYALVRTLAYMQTPSSFAEAATVLAQADRLAGQRLQQENALALQAALERGIFHLRRLQMPAALDALRRADRLQRTVAPDDAALAALIRTDIAEALWRSGRAQDALDWMQAMQADPLLAPARLGEVGVALLQSNQAEALDALGRRGEALALAQSAVQASTRFLGPDNYVTLVQRSTVARIQAVKGQCDAALPQAREVQARMSARFGETMQESLVQAGLLGELERQCGQADAGRRRLAWAADQLRAGFGADNATAQAFATSLKDP